jgi:hypothetical protein
MLIRGPSMGKNSEIAEIIHCRMEEVGSIFHITLVIPPPNPKYPKISPMILVRIEKIVLGNLLTIFLVLFLILSHRLLGS